MVGASMTQAKHWFAQELEFRQLCGDAQSLARSEAQQEFSTAMVIRAKRYGLDTYLTEKQLRFLCEIADWEIPQAL